MLKEATVAGIEAAENAREKFSGRYKDCRKCYRAVTD
jgi:hypothetical protein